MRVLHCLLQGVLYVTDVALCHYSNIIGVEVKDVIPLAHVTSLEKVVPCRASSGVCAHGFLTDIIHHVCPNTACMGF